MKNFIFLLPVVFASCSADAFNRVAATTEVGALTRVDGDPTALTVSIRPLAAMEGPQEVYVMRPPRPDFEEEKDTGPTYADIGKEAGGELLFYLLGGGAAAAVAGGGAVAVRNKRRRDAEEQSPANNT